MTNHESGNRVIAEFMEQDNICGILETGSNPLRAFFSYKEIKAFAKKGYSIQLQYHTSFDWIMPVRRKITEIGLWMMTNGHDKLWLEKSKEIDTDLLTAETPELAAIKISWIIKWYKEKTKTITHA